MKISIVIPAYNNADYLDETMKTVLGQTYTNLEVIVSDHASTDATWTVMQRYRTDPRVTLLHTEAGGGALRNWNRVSQAATGELIWELAQANGWPLSREAARALYVAILTDTGGFRFSNTKPRTLRIAADLLETGLDPEEIYLDVYANAPAGRPRLLAEALQTLVVEPELGLAWVTVPPGAMERHGVSSDGSSGSFFPVPSYTSVALVKSDLGVTKKNYGDRSKFLGGQITGGIQQQAGMEQPIYYWDPIIGPSGMTFYTGSLFPQWKGNLFVGGHGSRDLVRLTLNGEKIVGEERLLKDLQPKPEAIRDVRTGPDGALYLLTDGAAGRVLKLVPKK